MGSIGMAASLPGVLVLIFIVGQLAAATTGKPPAAATALRRGRAPHHQKPVVAVMIRA
jgi:hypothetical protein